MKTVICFDINLPSIGPYKYHAKNVQEPSDILKAQKYIVTRILYNIQLQNFTFLYYKEHLILTKSTLNSYIANIKILIIILVPNLHMSILIVFQKTGLTLTGFITFYHHIIDKLCVLVSARPI